MFVRITYMRPRTGIPEIDSYVKSFPNFTFPEARKYLMDVGFVKEGKLDDPDAFVMPPAIVEVAECDARGYTRQERENLAREVRRA